MGLVANQAVDAVTDDPGGELRIYARGDDAEIKLIADGTPVPDSRLFDVAFFSSPEVAAAVARACAKFLERSQMPADADGWHPLPARRVPVLIAAARNAAWADPEPPEPVEEIEDELDPIAPDLPPERRQYWSLRRVAWFGFLIGRGWGAKRIARDELIRTTPNNVYRQAHRLGLNLSAVPQAQVCLELPPSTMVAIDRAAALAHMQRDAFVRRLLIRAANDPGRFGLTVAGLG